MILNPINTEKVFDNSIELIVAFRESGQVCYMNRTACEELGFEATEVSVKQLFPNLFTSYETITGVVERFEKRPFRENVYRKNGTCFPATFKVLKGSDEGDEVVFFAFLLNMQHYEQQAKQLSNMEAEMNEITRSQTEFVSNLTHELRTPVNGIKGHVRNMIEVEEDQDKRRTMDIILTCCFNMEKIINNLLDFAKIENGKFEIEEAPFSIRQCINTTINTMSSVANEKGIQLSATVSDDVPEILVGDEFRISQIVNNLVSNAVKFTSIGSVQVEVFKTKQLDNQVELTFFVMDTGIGVSIEEKERMFQSFSQVDGSITRNFGGTGLGLYVCKQIVELMHGHIEVESEKGKGSTFIFTLILSLNSQNPTIEAYNEMLEDSQAVSIEELKKSLKNFNKENHVEETYIFGSKENRKNIDSSMEKLLLCMEVGNWNKAESISDNIKKLCENGPEDICKLIFRMQMQIRKEKYEKSIEALDKLREALDGDAYEG